MERLEEANRLLFRGRSSVKDVIFVYCAPKVGSTTLVTSLRLYLSERFVVIHVHNEAMLKVLYKIDNVTIQDIIEFNSKVLKKNVIVFDIFRHQIEHKMSIFF